jgi:peptidase E
MKRQIVAMGGGGFSMERTPRLDRYILDLTGKRRPRICFLPTASGDADGYVRKFYRAFRRFDCIPSHLSLFRASKQEVRPLLLNQDVIYVGGGRTSLMLLIWKAWGVDRLLHQVWRQGTILAGLSAGSICWFQEGLTDSWGRLAPMNGLGFLPGSHCPHYDGEAERRPMYRRFVARGILLPGYAADDGVGLHFVGTSLDRAVSSRRHAQAYRLDRLQGRATESPIPTDFLG